MINELNLLNELRIGDIVGDTNRMVIAYTKVTDRIPDDIYASWLAICVKQDDTHPYVIWDIVARPEGFSAGNGDYCSTLDSAITIYKQRGGEV